MHKHETRLDFRVGIVTVSTSRFEKYGNLRGIDKIPEDDGSGREIFEAFKDLATDYALVADDVEAIKNTVSEMLKECDAVIVNGGTGLNPKDVTIEAIEPLLEKKIDGFGEIFRYLSYKEVGTSAILSRATAGIVNSKAVFCLPGSRNAVELGLRIIRESLAHILSHAKGLK
ncbi:molybdopterin adenylyltransferase [Archaeoglobus sulfaticallidus PM70-1]|uniref:Molybdopterin adenylyltransferase n=1 Tax=Archaeoglobus sulfaticallidus PM70-1 TaxID=387631 RepID=N0BN72_9EURY|nr:MogA/MoaB family molybdenum cofactor biosynthesis protein [Archaeoglobus sulfaticallidus]AGK62061.1 molybdopterin adenylyltransferase [Archaeoglobus sulfaticallidus PM70-1]